jgi:hypothetical protein
MWVREPKLRIDAGFPGGEPDTWVTDGQTSNIEEPHVHVVALLSTDPREIFRSCQHPRLIGVDHVVGRPVTGVSCRSQTLNEAGTYWVDDETGVVLRGEKHKGEEASSWAFIEIEFNPEFPTGVFVVPESE